MWNFHNLDNNLLTFVDGCDFIKIRVKTREQLSKPELPTMTYWQGYHLTKERNVECFIYNILFSSIPSTMDSRTQTNTYFNIKVTQKSLVS